MTFTQVVLKYAKRPIQKIGLVGARQKNGCNCLIDMVSLKVHEADWHNGAIYATLHFIPWKDDLEHIISKWIHPVLQALTLQKTLSSFPMWMPLVEMTLLQKQTPTFLLLQSIRMVLL